MSLREELIEIANEYARERDRVVTASRRHGSVNRANLTAFVNNADASAYALELALPGVPARTLRALSEVTGALATMLELRERKINEG